MNLAGLSPREFYLYRETGIYPCDTYFGIPATQFRSLEELVESQKYMESMSVEERLERYSKPQSWQNSPELNYIYEMDGLFN